MNPARLMTAATLVGLPGVFVGARIFPMRWERIAVCLTILLLSCAWLVVISATEPVRELGNPGEDDT
jgi:xanthosine utilization system XapX-like protein